MRKFILGVLAFVLLLAVIAAGIVLSGNTLNVLALIAGPPRDWDEKRLAPAPDYAVASSWAAWPGREDFSDYAPQGLVLRNADQTVDVFFVHPTGYMNGADWNSPMNPDSRTEENTNWMMANQASAFNGVGRVYAPRYRQASFFRYISASDDVVRKTMDLAYGDVLRAFEHFLANENRGRPFIIASHSQGSQHAFRLLRERIDGTPLASQMVVAYVPGTDITNGKVAELKSIKVCDSPEQTGCLLHWATMGEGGTPPSGISDLVCVNPLTWKRDGSRAAPEAHKGGVPVSGAFSAQMLGDDAAQGMQFPPLGAPMPGLTWAECRAGYLYVRDLADTVFAALIIPGRNYHGLDYPLFHMDIRQNAEQRTRAWFGASQPAATKVMPQE
jgi:hypothetical protein